MTLRLRKAFENVHLWLHNQQHERALLGRVAKPAPAHDEILWGDAYYNSVSRG